MIKAILTDIEGTTSSLSFVKDVLFPYARERLGKFIRQHAKDPVVQRELDEVRRLSGKKLTDAEIVDQLIRWVDEDQKITPLKNLQGMIWENGYRQGDFKGHIYDDTERQLRKWRHQGISLYVFSSGSVQAQKLLFAHTEYGDLTPLFSGYFDTTIGNKREASSYRKIAESINTKPNEILFLSDIREELDAARAAGMQGIGLVREGVLDSRAAHQQVRKFDEIII